MTRKMVHALLLALAVVFFFACSSKKERISCITVLDCPEGEVCEEGFCTGKTNDAEKIDRDTAVVDEMTDELFDDEIEKDESDISDERDGEEDITDVVVIDEDAAMDDVLAEADEVMAEMDEVDTAVDEDTVVPDDLLPEQDAAVDEDTVIPDDLIPEQDETVDEDMAVQDDFVPDEDTLIDECTVNDNPCNDDGDSAATCTDEVSGYSCNCTFGFDPTLGGCHDIDECTAGTDTCDLNAACTNTTGGFTCDCNDYYSGNGQTCTFCDTSGQCGATCGACDGGTPGCRNNGNGTTECVVCTEEGHCSGGTPHCLPTQNICVACRDNSDCAALEVCLTATHTCALNICGDGEALRPSDATLLLPFNEGSGSTVYDRSGNGNAGAVNGAAWVDGRFGKALQFSGGQTVTLVESATLKTGAQLTVTAWIQGSTIPSNYVTIIQKDGTGLRNYGLFITGADQPADQGKVLFSLTSATPGDWHGPVSSVGVIDGNWHHIAGVYNGIDMKIFIDGVEHGSQAVGVTPADTAAGVSIGGGFTGSIDEVRLYHRALGSAEIAELANRRVHLPFEESGGTIAHDLSGNARNGTLHNAVSRTAGRFGAGLFFDGVDDALQWDYAGNTPVNNFTMMAWFTTAVERYTEVENTTTTSGTGIDNHYLFWPDNKDTEAGAGVSVGTNGISVYEHGNGYMPPLAVYDAAIGTGWNHVAVTYTDRQPRIYLNGVLVREGLLSPKSVVYAPQFAGVSGGFYGIFSGNIDDIRIYDRPLSAVEITTLMQNSYHDELCDDGNFADGDGCTTACSPEPLP